MQEHTKLTNTRAILKQLEHIRGIDKCKDDIKAFAKYIELNRAKKIKFRKL